MNNHRTKSGIAGGIFLIGLGVLIFTGNWWPGIMFVIGLAIGADRAFRGNYVQALTVLVFFSALPLLSAADIPWHIFGPFILISIGTVVLAQSFISKQS